MKKTSRSNRTKLEDVPAREGLVLENLPGYFLITCLVLAFLFLLKILSPFLTVIFVASILTIAFFPLYRKIRKFFGSWTRLSALVMCLFVVLVTAVPITIFIILLANEGVSTFNLVQAKINSGVFDKFFQWESGGVFYDLKEKVSAIVDLDSLNIKENIIKLAQTLSTFLVSQTATFLKSISTLVINIIIMLFVMFYFFKDGDRIVEEIGKISPLPKIHESVLFKKITNMVKAILIGVFLTAIVQGLIGGIGFTIAGVPNPVFWGTAIAFFSMIPMVGTALVWVPTAIILAILGSYGAAIFIFLWGALLIGTVDNIIKPYVIGGKAHTYPLLTFFVVLGGMWTMGFRGLIIGPIVLMVLMSFLHIYEIEYGKVLKK